MTSSLKEKYAVEAVNLRAKTDPSAFVAECENAYRERVRQVADSICAHGQRVVFLAGPTSSGKTTTANTLKRYLKEHGLQSVTVSLDDFLLDYNVLPRFADGTVDYDSPNTLDVKCFQHCIRELLETGVTTIPHFDFAKGGRNGGRELRIGQDHIVIVEGIHALNDQVVGAALDGVKLYISVKSEYYVDDKRVLNSKDMRLIRRVIRDAKFRASDANNTFDMWGGVCEGEKLYIRPFRETADFWLDSAHLYEPLIYKPYLLSALQVVKPESRYFPEAERLSNLIRLFDRMDAAFAPEDSMIREFIGN